MKAYEKLGAFYLGRRCDPDSGKIASEPLLYDAKDLTTHAVIIGMTGSGKTGLGVCLLEEAAIDRIPVIAVDPKGDLGNLLLNFPGLQPADFRPWVDPAAATTAGLDLDEFAAQQARSWREGLRDWDQEPERIGRLAQTVDMAIYTPGSSAGRPLSILGSLRCPAAATAQDPELFAQRVQAATTGLLTLLGIDADPLSSREHILLARLFDREWRAGRDVDLAGLIGAIQSPGIERFGVLALDDFYPPRDRMALAMRLNNLLASPGFASWLEGDPLDAQALLYTGSGKPRLSIVNIAHLSDAERMSVVTLLLAELLNWMRAQPGTGSLRALLYMDEIFGYLPPTANPPSKLLLLTLLKQARAFGLGLVLSTQNPVDLDYKALSNAGTWFIGRLQTDQDRARVLDGLRSSGADVAELSRWLTGLGKRRFLLHNVHDARPEPFATRWALSYLAGPLAREQIRRLTPAVPPAAEPAEPIATSPPSRAAVKQAPPPLPAGMKQYFLPLRRQPEAGQEVIYRPCLLAALDVDYHSARYKLGHSDRLLLALSADEGPVALDWDEAERLDESVDDLQPDALAGAHFSPCPGVLLKPRASWQKDLIRHVRNGRPLALKSCAELKCLSAPGESEGQFRIRLQQAASEKRDAAIAVLRERYDSKLEKLNGRLLSAQQAVERETDQSQQSKLDAALSFGSALLGAFMGRKTVSATNVRRVGAAARRAGRIRKEAADVGRAQERVELLKAQLDELAQAFEAEVDRLELGFDAQTVALEDLSIRAKSADIQVHFIALGWRPALLASAA